MSSLNHTSMTCLVLLFILTTLVSHTATRLLPETTSYESHEQWMVRYGRVYKDANEQELRSKIFQENVQYIMSSNSVMDKGYKLGLNEFVDLTNEEFMNTRNGFKARESTELSSDFRYENVMEVPSSIDWRSKGAVTAIKDQGGCGSCWAFSSVAAVEGITQIKTGQLISLSEQELIDCVTGGVTNGCEGGDKNEAFEFIVNNKGLTTESNYPYTSVQGICNSNQESSAMITGYENVPANDESALLKAVANQPISVAIDSSSIEFKFYSGGVFTGECGTNLNHAVTIVGYGTSDSGTKYWLVKNSWGTSWGQKGYIMMQRDVDEQEGLCGIAMRASYPVA